MEDEFIEKNELCGLYKQIFYERCRDCSGRDISRNCYQTELQVREHREHFFKRFSIEGDEPFTLENFGSSF